MWLPHSFPDESLPLHPRQPHDRGGRKNPYAHRDSQYQEGGRHGEPATRAGAAFCSEINFENGQRQDVIGDRHEIEERASERPWIEAG